MLPLTACARDTAIHPTRPLHGGHRQKLPVRTVTPSQMADPNKTFITRYCVLTVPTIVIIKCRTVQQQPCRAPSCQATRRPIWLGAMQPPVLVTPVCTSYCKFPSPQTSLSHTLAPDQFLTQHKQLLAAQEDQMSAITTTQTCHPAAHAMAHDTCGPPAMPSAYMWHVCCIQTALQSNRPHSTSVHTQRACCTSAQSGTPCAPRCSVLYPHHQNVAPHVCTVDVRSGLNNLPSPASQ